MAYSTDKDNLKVLFSGAIARDGSLALNERVLEEQNTSEGTRQVLISEVIVLNMGSMLKAAMLKSVTLELKYFVKI